MSKATWLPAFSITIYDDPNEPGFAVKVEQHAGGVLGPKLAEMLASLLEDYAKTTKALEETPHDRGNTP